MIHFEWSGPNQQYVEGIVRVSIDNECDCIYKKEQFPLFLIHKTLMGETIWTIELRPGHFSEFYQNTYTAVELIDSLGNKLFNWKWDPILHGDFAHQIFEIWSMNNLGSNGIAIGTHNGMTGEWVGPVNNGRLRATLIEASDVQYNDLVKYYKGKPWVTLKKDLITTDGSDVDFYEGGDGYTNSINKKIITNHVKGHQISKIKKSSKSINEIIQEVNQRGNVEWIHLDTEGMDGDLVYMIKDDLLPNLLLFESLHMDDDYKSEIQKYLISKDYSVNFSGFNCVCVRDK